MDQAAINNNVHSRIFTPAGVLDILQVLSYFENDVVNTLNDRVNIHGGIKWWISLFITYVRQSPDGEMQYTNIVFNSDTYRLFPADNLNEDLAEAFNRLYIQSEEFIAAGSAWSIHSIDRLELNNVRHNPVVGSYVPLPRGVPKRAVVNVKNLNDSKCIVWSILAQLRPVKSRPCNISSYKKYEASLNLAGVKFPTPIRDIEKIEQLNDLSIHVFIYESGNGGLAPYRISKEMKDTHINLLLLNAGSDDAKCTLSDINSSAQKSSFIHHYCLIRNFHLLMKADKDDQNLYRVRYCFNCLQRFSSQEVLDTHLAYCKQSKCQRTIFPSTENEKWISFKNYDHQLRAPFVIYADFECFTKKSPNLSPNLGNESNINTTRNYQRHIPSGFCYLVVSTCDRFSSQPVLYRGSEGVVEKFFDQLIAEEKRITDIMKQPIALDCSEAVEQQFVSQKACHICGEHFSDNSKKVRDHDHLTGEFRGAAHNSCNLKYRYSKVNPLGKYGFKIPVIFHNLKGYDSHLLMEAFGKYKERYLSCIASNSERFITFSTGALTFIDSLQFMASSLERLVKNLTDTDGDDKFDYLKKTFTIKEQRNVLLRKGIFPYDFFDGPDKFQLTNLPPKASFFSELNQEDITDDDYKHALNVWRVFDCKTFADYHDIYLKADVLQLADVFENFRNMSLDVYHLDPAHYVTAPGLAWDAMLR